MWTRESCHDLLNSRYTFLVSIDNSYYGTMARLFRAGYVRKHDGFDDMADEVQYGHPNAYHAFLYVTAVPGTVFSWGLWALLWK